MDRQDSWKKTDDIEVNLTDMLESLCRQWKRFLICALAAAAILGGYGWLQGNMVIDSFEASETEDTELTEEEKQAVLDAVYLKKQIVELKMYLENSIIMKINPYHKVRYMMLYSIDQAERRELARITESYLSFVSNGGAADALIKSVNRWKMEKSYLSEVITSYQKTYTFPYQTVVDSAENNRLMAESLFYVEVAGKNAEQAQQMALDIQTVLEEYSDRAKKTVGRHRLSLISSVESVTVDNGLQSQQNDKRNLLSSSNAGLKAATDAFSRKQMAEYKEIVGMESVNEEGKKNSVETVSEEAAEKYSVLVIKYALAGFAGGILAYFCVFACWYLFSDTVKSIDEMKKMYTFPVYGNILLKTGDKSGIRKYISCKDAYGNTGVQTVKRIRLACKKQGITELYAV